MRRALIVAGIALPLLAVGGGTAFAGGAGDHHGPKPSHSKATTPCPDATPTHTKSHSSSTAVPSVTATVTPSISVTPSSTAPAPTPTKPHAPLPPVKPYRKLIKPIVPVFVQATCGNAAQVTVTFQPGVFWFLDGADLGNPNAGGNFTLSAGKHYLQADSDRNKVKLVGQVEWDYLVVVPKCVTHTASPARVIPAPSDSPSLKPVAAVQPQLASTGATWERNAAIAVVLLVFGGSLIWLAEGRKTKRGH